MVVEVLLLYNLVAALLQAALAPVAGPPLDTWEKAAGKGAGGINLLQVFPAGRSQAGGQGVHALSGGVLGGALKAEAEAAHTALPALRLVLEAAHGLTPGSVVVVVFYYFYAELFTISPAFRQAKVVFFAGDNVRVGEEHYRFYSLFIQSLYYGPAAWRAANM